MNITGFLATSSILKEISTNHADEQYVDRNKLDLAIPTRPLASMLQGLHKIKKKIHQRIIAVKSMSVRYATITP